jgi:AcrR family transcriptional regulator
LPFDLLAENTIFERPLIRLDIVLNLKPSYTPMFPKTPEQFEQMRTASRRKILQTSLSLFARQGYEGASIRMIAQEANMAVGLLYNYYPSKEAVLQAIFQQNVEIIRESFPKIPTDLPPQAQLEEIIRNTFRVLAENLEFWQVFYILRIHPAIQENLQKEIEELSNIMLGELLRVFRLMPNISSPEAELIVFIALVDGIGVHYTMSPQYYPLKEITESIVQKYCGQGVVVNRE